MTLSGTIGLASIVPVVPHREKVLCYVKIESLKQYKPFYCNTATATKNII